MFSEGFGVGDTSGKPAVTVDDTTVTDMTDGVTITVGTSCESVAV